MAYPTSVIVFTTHNTGDIIQASDPNTIQTEVTAIEQDLINGAIRLSLTPNVDVTYNIGTASKRWQNFQSSALVGLDIASRSNFIVAQAAITGAAPTLQSSGASDATINLLVGTKGGTQLKLIDVASIVNFLQVSSKATGGAPDLAFQGADATVNGTISTKGGVQAKFIDAASLVNFVQIAGAATSGTVGITFQGADATVNGTIATKGGTQLKFVDVASIVNFLQFAGTATGTDPTLSVQGDGTRGLKIATAGTGPLTILSGSANLVLFNPNGSAVNYFSISNAASGNSPAISSTGTDTNIGYVLAGKGNGTGYYKAGSGGGGSHQFQDTAGNPLFIISEVNNPVDYIQTTPAATANPATVAISALGTDANINLNLISKGTGTVQVNGITIISAPTITLKKGSQTGTDYTTTSATYVDVDATNLALTVTIPTGQKLAVTATMNTTANAAGNQGSIRIVDGTASVAEAFVSSGGITSYSTPVALSTVITGDGASHTIKLQFAAAGGFILAIQNRTLSTTTTPNLGLAQMTFVMQTAS